MRRDMGITVKIADNYINLLSSVSDEVKLRVINKLSENLLKGKKKEISIKDSFGAWNDDRSAEEIIKDIHDARILGTRKIEPLEG